MSQTSLYLYGYDKATNKTTKAPTFYWPSDISDWCDLPYKLHTPVANYGDIYVPANLASNMVNPEVSYPGNTLVEKTNTRVGYKYRINSYGESGAYGVGACPECNTASENFVDAIFSPTSHWNPDKGKNVTTKHVSESSAYTKMGRTGTYGVIYYKFTLPQTTYISYYMTLSLATGVQNAGWQHTYISSVLDNTLVWNSGNMGESGYIKRCFKLHTAKLSSGEHRVAAIVTLDPSYGDNAWVYLHKKGLYLYNHRSYATPSNMHFLLGNKEYVFLSNFAKVAPTSNIGTNRNVNDDGYFFMSGNKVYWHSYTKNATSQISDSDSDAVKFKREYNEFYS